MLVVSGHASAQPDGDGGVPREQRSFGALPESSWDFSRNAVPGRLLVKISADADRVAAMGTLEALSGARVGERGGPREVAPRLVPGLTLVEVPAGSERALAALLEAHGDFAYAGPDTLGGLTQVGPPTATCDAYRGDDPRAGEMWWINDINMPAAWNAFAEIEVPETVVAVIDSGVNFLHPDLAPHMWVNPGEVVNGVDDADDNAEPDDIHGAAFVPSSGPNISCLCVTTYSFCDFRYPPGCTAQLCHGAHYACLDSPVRQNDFGASNGGDWTCPLTPALDCDGSPVPEYPVDAPGSHGTACAQLIAAVADNEVETRGVACSNRVMAVRVFWTCSGGRGQLVLASDYIAGLDYAATMGARVISNSMFVVDTTGVEDAVASLESFDVLFVTSAGNAAVNLDDGSCLEFGCGGFNSVYAPQNYQYPHVLQVGASTVARTRASFSNAGAIGVDVFAPGVNIPVFVKSWATDRFIDTNASDRLANGTSFSAPIVAGLAGLYWSLNPSSSAQGVASALRGACAPTGTSLDALCECGGVVDAKKLFGL
jgi:subtilisin family serine protease